jgi:site-specific DNA-methyltransferase (adenine-specific)
MDKDKPLTHAEAAAEQLTGQHITACNHHPDMKLCDDCQQRNIIIDYEAYAAMPRGQPRIERIGDATLYLGDCLDILPTLEGVDAVVTDPPYGISGRQNSRTRTAKYSKNDYLGFTDSIEYVMAVVSPAIIGCLNISKRMIITPGNRCLTEYPTPDSFGVIVQPASVGLQAWGRADCQPILFYGKSPHAGTNLPSQSCVYKNTESSSDTRHPCAKPIKLWTNMVHRNTEPTDMVLDPFMGSGTTGVACANLGRKFIGIEIEPKYFDIACERITAAYAQGRLFG